MNDHRNQKTTIWEYGGIKHIKTMHGLPYGVAEKIYIEGLGEALKTGVIKSGSGSNESIIEVKYELKQ